jgi:hypothetical protein
MPLDSVPRWSSLARSGAPAGESLWPFDPELAQLELSLRRVIKRETRSDEEARVAVEWFRTQALEVVQDGSVVLAAEDAGVLPLARALDAAGDRDAPAVRELGALLGYPSCCVERYLGLDLRDDAALFSVLLPSEPTPAPAESLWLVGALALVSHAPCGLSCAGTLALGRATLAALEVKYPGFAPRWRALAARLHQIDDQGRVFSTSAEVLEVVADPIPRTHVSAAAEAARVRWQADHRGV